MPAYSYNERFVPMVKDGSKPHTIRSRRKNPAKPGDILYHYYGLRTKHCMKLAEDICKDVRSIYIDEAGDIFLLSGRLLDEQADMLLNSPGMLRRMAWRMDGKNLFFRMLDFVEASQLAWLDGFRPDGSTLQDPAGAHELMKRFWMQTHDLPFLGDIIYRQPYAKI